MNVWKRLGEALPNSVWDTRHPAEKRADAAHHGAYIAETSDHDPRDTTGDDYILRGDVDPTPKVDAGDTAPDDAPDHVLMVEGHGAYTLTYNDDSRQFELPASDEPAGCHCYLVEQAAMDRCNVIHDGGVTTDLQPADHVHAAVRDD